MEDDFLTALNSESEYNNHDETVVMDAYQSPEMSASSILNLFDTNREQRMSFVMQILGDMDEGRRDARLVHLNIKNMEDILAMMTDTKKYPVTATAYRKMLMDECEKWGKNFDFHNSKFSIRGTGGKADYSQCNDPVVLELESIFEITKSQLEERRKFLDSLPVSGIEQVDTDTGEQYTIYPPAKPKNETVVVKLS